MNFVQWVLRYQANALVLVSHWNKIKQLTKLASFQFYTTFKETFLL